jgi:hypothetical protein
MGSVAWVDNPNKPPAALGSSTSLFFFSLAETLFG